MSSEVKRRDGTPATTKVSRKHQVTLPVAALELAHVEPGDVLRVEVEADGVFRLVRQRNPRLEAMEEFFGSAADLTTADEVEELRDEWAR